VRTSYMYDADGRLSSSLSTPEPEFDAEDLYAFEALREVEGEFGPHGFHMSEATDPAADPNDPEALWRFVAGTPVVDPETKEVVYAGTFDWAEKVRLDALDKLRGQKPDPLNGIVMPVFRVRHTPRPRRRRARRPQGPPA